LGRAIFGGRVWQWVGRSTQEIPNPIENHAIMDIISTIVVYKFTHLSRREVDTMLGVRLEETRVHQEAREEGREEQARSLILSLLTRRVGKLSQQSQLKIEALSRPQLEKLGEVLLDLSTIAELDTWLTENH
jgi:predicted transposase YdaD